MQPPLAVADGRLAYGTDTLGNRIPDFSYAGYRGGDAPIPDASIQLVVYPHEGDMTYTIQQAIDQVASLPADHNGLKGTVLLAEGEFRVYGTIRLHSSGVVLRGSGFDGKHKTLLVGCGTTRQTLLEISGKDDRQLAQDIQVTSAYVPVNARTFDVADASSLKVGDEIIIHRPSTEDWIKTLGTDHFGGGITSLGWKAGRRDLRWDRRITAIRGNTIEVDAPITTALDQQYGRAKISRYTWKGRISETGIENIHLMSTYDPSNPKDEDHRWMAITINHAENVWVRRTRFQHFAGSAVYVLDGAKKVTVEDCISSDPVSEVGGQRRYTFYTRGQQTLFQRLVSKGGYHDFAVGYLATGPNAFVQCHAIESHSFSGTIDSWASGVLFDVVDIDGQALRYANRGQDGNGAGWTAANSVFWQCSAARVDNERPPTAQNWAFGIWSQFQGNGHWERSNEHIKPRSLYYAQLRSRLGEAMVDAREILLPVPTEASSSPSVEAAAELSELAKRPAIMLEQFIVAHALKNPLDIHTAGIRSAERQDLNRSTRDAAGKKITLTNGWLHAEGQVVVGGKTDVQWWSGSARDYWLPQARPHITRFVPGETGLGLTDDLDEMTDTLLSQGIVTFDHNYGLWYDRRRDDHERIRRIDGEVWPPFYELPFARSGRGTAYDGLSKYDLTKYNHFYWDRLAKFAELADQKGLVLLHQNYFQHNILEAGAHYTDFPWRTANNINDVGFPEPVAYAGDKRIFMAEQFYDVTHPVRRELHRAYIRKCLDNFKDYSNVLQLISAEYTGPLHFVQFWIDVIKEWEAETGKDVLVALSTTKDVQDAILNDPERAAVVDVIDIRYWHYQENGEVYAPEGGKHLAPRQHARLSKPRKTSVEQVYRAVSEYRSRYPDKAVLYHASNYPAMGWAVFMAGGSMANLSQVGDGSFYRAALKAKPVTLSGMKVLRSDDGMIVFREGEGELSIDLTAYKGDYNVYHIHPKTGEIFQTDHCKGGAMLKVAPSKHKTSVLWISKRT